MWCPSLVARLIVLLLATFAFAAPASAGGEAKAKPPTLTIGPPRYRNVHPRPTLDRVKLELFPDARQTRVLLTLAISTPAIEWHRSTRGGDIGLSLPDTARVVGLALKVGARQRFVAKANLACAVSADCSDHNTWQRFVALRSKGVDAALLRFQYAVKGNAQYVVHLPRLVQDAPVMVEVEVELELPPAGQLDVASARAVADYVVEIDSVAQEVKPLAQGYKPQRIALRTPRPHDRATEPLLAEPAVNDHISLLVDASTSKPTGTH